MVPSQPAPPGALDWDGLLGELLDEVFVGAKLCDYLLGEKGVLVGVLASALADRGQVFPIDGVIDMSAQIELDGLSESRHFVVIKVGRGL